MRQKVLEISHATMQFGGLVAVNDLTMYIDTQEIVALIGPNGAGKTTAFNMVTGVYRPTSGFIFLNKRDITGMRPDQITRLGIAMGCQPRTFTSLAGIGDLIVTATSPHSRNNRAGKLMGEGASAQEAAKKVGMVVEGINAIPAAVRLAEKYQVDMPIVQAVADIVAGNENPVDAVSRLMQRDKKHEFEDQG